MDLSEVWLGPLQRLLPGRDVVQGADLLHRADEQAWKALLAFAENEDIVYYMTVKNYGRVAEIWLSYKGPWHEETRAYRKAMAEHLLRGDMSLVPTHVPGI